MGFWDIILGRGKRPATKKQDSAKERKFREAEKPESDGKKLVDHEDYYEKRHKEHRKHKGYRRTSGYRNFINRLAWLPRISGGIALMKSGARYDFRDDGWRRLPDEPKAKEAK